MMNDYRVSVKVRNNRIIKSFEAIGVRIGQKWCSENKISYADLNGYVNLTLSPLTQDGGLRVSAVKLCELLMKCPDDLWSSQQLYPLEKNFTDIEMSYEEILNLSGAKSHYFIDSDIEKTHLKSAMVQLIDELTDREQQVLKMRFYDDLLISDVAKSLGVSFEYALQIEAKALRKLRHPTRATKIVDFIDFPQEHKTNADYIHTRARECK